MPDFNMSLNEDQLQIQKWVHDFAEDVVRPAAEEWDEREEFPWPIVAGGGQDRPLRLRLHGQRHARRPHRPHPAGRHRGAVLGRRRHRPVDLRLGPGRRRHHRQRHPRAGHRVGAAVLRHARQGQARRLLRERARRRLRRVARCAPGPSTTRPRTSGCSTAPRRGSPTAASPTSTWSWPPSTPSSRAAGQASFIVPPGHAGPVAGPEVQEARHPRLAHRRGRARRRAGARLAACSAARRSSTRSWPGPARR